ncbi:DUF6801 domain-containing protein [Actinokineospora soli]|uniref:DUF6801 domain-containing protein n=1 Tax=Actinokineospora soli TaxID=1048753 RepID=A0ABW2TPY5_9PSEU
MSSFLTSRTRRVAAVLAAAGLAALTAGVATGNAAEGGPARIAGPVEKKIVFNCELPMVGVKPVEATVKVTFPDSGKVGEIIQPTDFATTVALNDEVTQALKLVGAATIEGIANPQIDATLNDTKVTLALPLTIPSSPVAESGPTTLPFEGGVPGFAVHEAGTVTVAVGAKFTGKATPKDASGKETGLGTIDLACTQAEGQDAALASIPVA